MKIYSLRPAAASDYDFLRNVHHTTLKDHVTNIWGWREQQQDEFFKEDFDSGELKVILNDEQRAGYLQVNYGENVCTIVNILILPDFQGRGIGSAIIKELIREALSRQWALKLGVFKVNPRARKLYEALGFKLEVETATHFRMTYRPE